MSSVRSPAPKVAPTGAERILGGDEVIVSKTDLQGRITYVNDAFLEISKYREDDVIGMPHNIIRHPDMPRAVFALLWSEIKAGRELFAYVNNLAADGAHYWVLAHVTPTIIGGEIVGFHSNRRQPERSAIAAIEPVYRALIAEERRHPHPVEALAASTALLESVLAERSVTYDEYFWGITEAAA